MSGFCDCNGNGKFDEPDDFGFDCEDLRNKSISCSNLCPKVEASTAQEKEAASGVQLPRKQQIHHKSKRGEPEQLVCAPGEMATLVREAKPGRVASVADVIESSICAGSRSCKFPGVDPNDACGLQDGHIRGSAGLYSIDTSPFFLDFTCFINHGCVRKPQNAPAASNGHETDDGSPELEAPAEVKSQKHEAFVDSGSIAKPLKDVVDASADTDDKANKHREEKAADKGDQSDRNDKGDKQHGTTEEAVYVNPWAKSNTDPPVSLGVSTSCSWRATADCKRGGKRLPSKDVACGEAIPTDQDTTAGWCDCNGNSEQDKWEMGYDCHSVERMPTCAAMCKYVTVAQRRGL